MKNNFYIADERASNGEGAVYIFDSDSIIHEYNYFDYKRDVVYFEHYKNGKLVDFQGSPMVSFQSDTENNKKSIYLYIFSLNKIIDSPTLYYRGKKYKIKVEDLTEPLQSNFKYGSVYLKGFNKTDKQVIFSAIYNFCNGDKKRINDTLRFLSQ